MSSTRIGALGALALVALIGLIDAGRDAHWDLSALFGLTLVITLSLLPGVVGGRRRIAVRADLGRWLAQRASTTGEAEEVIADRAIADLRDRIETSPDHGRR